MSAVIVAEASASVDAAAAARDAELYINDGSSDHAVGKITLADAEAYTRRTSRPTAGAPAHSEECIDAWNAAIIARRRQHRTHNSHLQSTKFYLSCSLAAG